MATTVASTSSPQPSHRQHFVMGGFGSVKQLIPSPDLKHRELSQSFTQAGPYAASQTLTLSVPQITLVLMQECSLY